jgi:hypothetical protein
VIVHQEQPSRKAGPGNLRPESAAPAAVIPHPPSIRFGCRDPRVFEFMHLVGNIDHEAPAWMVNESIARLAKLGYAVTLTRESEALPTLPVLTHEDKVALAHGQKFPWQDPHHIASTGEDE